MTFRSRASLATLVFLLGCGPRAAEQASAVQTGTSALFVNSSWVWNPPVVSVCWESDDPAYEVHRSWVKSAVENTWQQVSGLRFDGWHKCEPVLSIYPQVRIGVADAPPHVVNVGTLGARIYNNMMLNFWFESWNPECPRFASLQYCVQSVAVRQFGHALSFVHEQNRPDSPPLPPDCEQQGSGGDKYLGPYDPDSVMNDCSRQRRDRLSPGDIAGVQKIYGFNAACTAALIAWDKTPLPACPLRNDEGRCVVPIQRGRVGFDLYYTADVSKNATCNVMVERPRYFHLAEDPWGYEVQPLYRCYDAGVRQHLLTTDSSCEAFGRVAQRAIIGGIALGPRPGSVPLHRLYKEGEHLYTIDPQEVAAAEQDGWAYQSVVGHVWPSAAGPYASAQNGSYSVGEPILVEFNHLPPLAGVWIAIAPVGAAADGYVSWSYTGGETAGRQWFLGMASPGAYEVRVYQGDGTDLVAIGHPFTVFDTRATVMPERSRYSTGEDVVALFAGLPGSAKDWISVAPDGSPPTSTNVWKYTGGAREGRLSLSGLPPGVYRLRAYANDSFMLLAESNAFTVSNPPATITTDKRSYAAGEPVTVRFAGLTGAARDWIAVAPDGSDLRVTTAWKYTWGAQGGAVSFETLPPGIYRPRAFANDTYNLVVEGDTFTVSP